MPPIRAEDTLAACWSKRHGRSPRIWPAECLLPSHQRQALQVSRCDRDGAQAALVDDVRRHGRLHERLALGAHPLAAYMTLLYVRGKWRRTSQRSLVRIRTCKSASSRYARTPQATLGGSASSRAAPKRKRRCRRWRPLSGASIPSILTMVRPARWRSSPCGRSWPRLCFHTFAAELSVDAEASPTKGRFQQPWGIHSPGQYRRQQDQGREAGRAVPVHHREASIHGRSRDGGHPIDRREPRNIRGSKWSHEDTELELLPLRRDALRCAQHAHRHAMAGARILQPSRSEDGREATGWSHRASTSKR